MFCLPKTPLITNREIASPLYSIQCPDRDKLDISRNTPRRRKTCFIKSSADETFTEIYGFTFRKEVKDRTDCSLKKVIAGIIYCNIRPYVEIYSGDLNYQQLMILITAPHRQPEIMKEIFLGRAVDWWWWWQEYFNIVLRLGKGGRGEGVRE